MQHDFSYDEEEKAILAREVKQLRNKQVPLLKVLWQHHGREEATWEPEATMRAQYLQLFSSGNDFDGEILLRRRGGCNTLNYALVVFLTCLGYNKSKCIFFRNLNAK